MTKFLIIITVFGAIIRLITLFKTPLLYDESFDILLSRNPDFTTRMEAIIEGHPPLYFTILNIWQTFSTSLNWARLLSLFLGILAILSIAQVAKKLFNQKIGLLAAFLTAVSPSHIFYSSIARSYSLAILETIFIILFFIQFLKSKTKILPLIFFLTLGIYTHYFFVIMLALLNLYLIFQHKITKKWVFGNIGIFLLCLPLLYLIFSTPKFQAPPYQSPLKLLAFYLTSFVPWDIIQNLQIYLQNTLDLTSILTIILIFISLILFLATIIKLKKNQYVLPLISIYVLAPILIMFISYSITPIAAIRSFTIFSPFYLLAIAIFLSSINRKPRVMLLIVLTFFSLLFWANFLFGEKAMGAVYEQLYPNLASNTLIVYNDVTLFLPSQLLNPAGNHQLIFPGHLRQKTYEALGIKILPFSHIPKSQDIRYARLPTRWPQFEKQADQLENYLKNNYQEIGRQKYRRWQLILYQKDLNEKN